MNKDRIKEDITQIFREVFDNNSLVINNKTSEKDIPEWDSLTNIQLILEIQNQFNIKLTIEETIKQKNVGTLIETIHNKINN